MTTDIAEPPPPVEAVETKGAFERIIGVLFSPGETFRDIARRPSFIVPLLLIVILGFVSTALTLPKFDYESFLQQQADVMKKKNPNFRDSDLEGMTPMLTASVKVMSWLGPLLIVLWWVIIAAILMLGTKIMGGRGTFKQAFAATVHAWIPMTIFGIILTIVIVMRGSFDPLSAATLVKSNPAFLVDMKAQPVLFAILSSLDIFTIWFVALLVIGFSELSGLSRGKTAAVVVGLWVVQILIKTGFAAMNA